MSLFDELKYAITHDPCRAADRFPLGAVTCGTRVDVTLRVDAAARGVVGRACVHVFEAGEWRSRELEGHAQGFSGGIEFSENPHVAFYVFSIESTAGEAFWYVPRLDGRTTAGELVRDGVEGTWDEGGWTHAEARLACRPQGVFGLADAGPGFQVTVYDGSFETPAWMAGAIMYQVFPDRFARGSGGVRAEGVAYHKRMKRPVRLHEDWDEPVEWTAGAASDIEKAMKAYDPVDFYGGTLSGIAEKLDYLASLGVEVLYLNPVFEARSNHRYDTADYEHVDPMLGADDDLRALVRAAEERGISVVLDGVLSHTGNDSRYFNAMHSYDTPGASQGADSPYFSWYDFTEQENGVGYKCWWGDRTLPEVDEHDASWQRYMLGVPFAAGGAGVAEGSDEGAGEGAGAAGVLAKWLAAGIRGYRLDVADEVPDDVLELVRSSVKRARSDAVIIGEVWEDATTKASYGTARTYALGTSLDSVMNYPLRDAVIGFGIGKIDAFQLATFLKLQQANYPRPLYRCLMNLLSSHDVERLRTVLSLKREVKSLSRNEQAAIVDGISGRRDEKARRLQKMLASIQYALPGAPCLYYGDERGLHGGGDPFCRATFPWNGPDGRRDCGGDLTSFYRKVGMRRKGSAALRAGELASLALSSDVLCLLRVDAQADEAVLVVANRADEACRFAVDLMEVGRSLDAREQDAMRRSAAFQSSEDGIIIVDAPACTTTFTSL